MATLEQIIDKARSLSPAEKRRLLDVLDLELDQVKVQARAQPTPSENGDDETRERRIEWLKSHREEYAGQYVALLETCWSATVRQFAKPTNKLKRRALRILSLCA